MHTMCIIIVLSLYPDTIDCSTAILSPSESILCGITHFWHDSIYLCFCFCSLSHSHVLRTTVPTGVVIPNALGLGVNTKYPSERPWPGSPALH